MAAPLPPPDDLPQQPGNFPPALKWAVALIVIGGLAEWLYRSVSPTAGYTLIAIVILAYTVQHGTDNFTNFFKKVGIPV